MSVFLFGLGYLLMGGLVGFTGGVLGIGGGLLAIPLLGLLGMPQQLAQGTALIMVLPAVSIAIRQYHQHVRIDWRTAVVGGLSTVAFTWLGARLALGLDAVLLRRIYAGFVFGIALFYFHQTSRRHRVLGRRRRKDGPRAIHRRWFALVGMVGGLAGGVFGVGGSVLIVPMLTTYFRYPQTSAQALALSMVLPGMAVALFTYSVHGQVSWPVGIPLALGGILMVPHGVRLAHALPEPRLKLIFACMLLLIMVLLLLKA